MKRLFALILAIATCAAMAVTASAASYEAEDAVLNGNAKIVDSANAYGGKVVEPDGSVVFEFSVETADFYHIRVYYRNPSKVSQTFRMSVEGRSVDFAPSDASRGSRWFNVYLEPGEHTLTVDKVQGQECPQIDMAIVEYKEDFGMGGDSGTPDTVPEVSTADDIVSSGTRLVKGGNLCFFHYAIV